ncbi:MAG: PLP-dependent aminotransferase family protein [Kiloniellales bacterium]|nr:PLP-dependent aminotransferase family protein [Kiloniellales bacterium]
MTSWQPTLEGRSGPRYQAIAQALADDIATGRLAVGDRLPTHRDLAWRLGVTVGTVTRAYAEAERRGLIAGEVGRGTFVQAPRKEPPAPATRPPRDGSLIDLSYNFPPDNLNERALADVLLEICREESLGPYMRYEMGLGQPRQRAAGARWMAHTGLAADPSEVVLTAGGQHGVLLAVRALARPGEVILTGELSYYGIKSIAAMLDIRLHGLAMDEEGLRPDALAQACRATKARALYCIPTLQNPTAAVMSEGRRREIAAICAEHALPVIEDDVYGFLVDRAPPPLSTLLPDSAIYVTGLSKSVSPGLRVGFLRAPGTLLDRLRQGLRASTLMAPPLMAEAATRLIESGAAWRMALWQRDEAEARQAIARRCLPAGTWRSHPQAFHGWLELPEPWRREVFCDQARARGVGVASAELFAVGRQPLPHAVRLCLQAARDRAELETALDRLAAVLAGQPETLLPVV